MSRKKKALRVGPNVGLSPAQIQDGRGAFAKWHWGIEPQRVVDWNDPDYPPTLIECGRLIRIQVRAPRSSGHVRHPRRQRDIAIDFARSTSDRSHLAYDPDHPDGRLYTLIPASARQALAQRFWHMNHVDPVALNYLASIAGGRHGRRSDYPSVLVKPVGVVTALIYYTHKKGDENPNDPRSHYIHQVGELSSIMPILGCDRRGRLWLAGGHYRTPTPGITD